MRSTGIFGRVRPVRAIVIRLSRLPRGRRSLRRAPPRTPSRTTASHVVRHHIDDARQSATPAGSAHKIRDAVQSEYKIILTLKKIHIQKRDHRYFGGTMMTAEARAVIILYYYETLTRSWARIKSFFGLL